MSIKAARAGGAMTVTGTPGAGRRPVLSWVESTREARRLRAARKAAGLSMPEVAGRLGVGVGWLQFRETGKTPLTAEEVTRIGQAIRDEARRRETGAGQ